MRQQYARDRDAALTNEAEIRAVVGLLYAIGLHQSGHTNVDDVWADDGFGIDIADWL